MIASRKVVKVWMFVLLLALTTGVAHAAGDGGLLADTGSLDTVAAGDCGPDPELMAALGVEIEQPVSEGFSDYTWTCGSCSVSICANRPVGTWCGGGLYCVVTTVCSAQPYTERCVCGTDHA